MATMNALEAVGAAALAALTKEADRLRGKTAAFVVCGFDWLETSSADTQRILEWPFLGLWFDVQENDLWRPEWGDKPKALFDQGKSLGCGHKPPPNM